MKHIFTLMVVFVGIAIIGFLLKRLGGRRKGEGLPYESTKAKDDQIMMPLAAENAEGAG